MKRLHAGTLLAGMIFLATGVVFVLEAVGVWTMSIADLRFIVPLAMVVVGVAVIIGSLSRQTPTG